MSEWLHITGNIRLMARDVKSKKDFKQLRNALGKKIGHVQSYWGNLPKTTLPSGSEGSLEWSLTNDKQFMPRNTRIGTLQNISLTIHGDLRNVSSINSLKLWLANYVNDNNLSKQPFVASIDFGVVSARMNNDSKIYNFNYIDAEIGWTQTTIDAETASENQI